MSAPLARSDRQVVTGVVLIVAGAVLGITALTGADLVRPLLRLWPLALVWLGARMLLRPRD